MPTLDDAFALVDAGWSIIPLRGKVPLTSHGVKDASRDPAVVRSWWATREHNIGARVPEHLVVLDIDPQNGGSVDALREAAGGPLPPTLTVATGRGNGGRHLYFAHPGGTLSSSRLPAGIDVKTSAGYCVVPPSIHPLSGKPYVWADLTAPAPLPPALVRLCRPAARPPAPRRPNETQLGTKALHLARYVSERPEGHRNAGLFWAACRALDEGLPAETFDLLEGAAAAAGLSQEEARRTIDSARRQVRA